MKPANLMARLGGCLALGTSPGPLSAQSVRPDAPGAAALAKYDKNGNGRLEADELAALQADEARFANSAVSAAATSAGDPIVAMSPFEVDASSQRGYFAANTMSGTRVNSKLEDLASSITVMTKEQMSDFAMLDLNDVFLYAANTEGTGTYTDFSIDRNGSVADNMMSNPLTANRVRGIGPANVSLGNFETSNRVPIDPISTDGVEISRGPNANVFGLGNAAGTVNQVPASANLSRPRSEIAFRADTYDGWRTSVDLNRVLKPGLLAARISAVRQHDGFVRKPSGMGQDDFDAWAAIGTSETTDLTAKGTEVEINFNPTRSWTVQLGGAETQSINNNMSPGMATFVAQRLPVYIGRNFGRTRSTPSSSSTFATCRKAAGSRRSRPFPMARRATTGLSIRGSSS